MSLAIVSLAPWPSLKLIAHLQKLEYCLFQPGLFLNYLAFPYKTSKHLEPLGTVFDFQNHRAILVQGHETAFVTLTTVTDFAHMMVMAVDFEDEWPTVGGIQGTKVTVTQIIEIGERVRGLEMPSNSLQLN